MQILAIGIGGAIGAMLRYTILQLFEMEMSQFPLAIFLCNILGCLFFAFIMAKPIIQSSIIRLFTTTGILGAFTTFSTFSSETIQLLQHGQVLIALSYNASTIIVGLGFAIIGYRLGGGHFTHSSHQ